MNLSEKITKASRSNFAPSFLFLPKDQRKAIQTVYAFSRVIDDAVDQEPSSAAAREKIDFYRKALDAAMSGVSSHPVISALGPVAERYDISHDLFYELIAGVEMDLTIRRYRTFEELSAYCYKVASVIGLICIRIFGCRTPESRDHAIAQGIAFQLTNILRDVGADFRRDRIYIPQEDLIRFGYTEKMLESGIRNEPFRNLMAFEAERAEEYYRRARMAIQPEDRRALVASEIMSRIYGKILLSIRRSDYDVLTRRISLGTGERLWLAVQGWFLNRVGTA